MCIHYGCPSSIISLKNIVYDLPLIKNSYYFYKQMARTASIPNFKLSVYSSSFLYVHTLSVTIYKPMKLKAMHINTYLQFI